MNLKREQRVDSILSSLKMLDYLSTSQLQKLHNLGGDRNTLRVLQSLDQYVSSFRDTENVYYLSKAGRERIGATVARAKLSTVGHYLMRNDLYIKKRPEIFKPEQRIKVGELTIVTDAIMQSKGSLSCMVEIDHTQRMVHNKTKIDKYRKLKETGAFQKQHGYFPRLIWVTCSDTRVVALKELCEGLDTIVYLWNDIK